MSSRDAALEATRKWIKVKSQLAKQRRVGAALARALVRRIQHHAEDADGGAGNGMRDDLGDLFDAVVPFVLGALEADYASVVLYAPRGGRDPPVLTRWSYANEAEVAERDWTEREAHTFTDSRDSPLTSHLRKSLSEEEGGPASASKARVHGFACAAEEVTLQQSVRDCYRSGKPAIVRGTRRTVDLAATAQHRLLHCYYDDDVEEDAGAGGLDRHPSFQSSVLSSQDSLGSRSGGRFFQRTESFISLGGAGPVLGVDLDETAWDRVLKGAGKVSILTVPLELRKRKKARKKKKRHRQRAGRTASTASTEEEEEGAAADEGQGNDDGDSGILGVLEVVRLTMNRRRKTLVEIERLRRERHAVSPTAGGGGARGGDTVTPPPTWWDEEGGSASGGSPNGVARVLGRSLSNLSFASVDSTASASSLLGEAAAVAPRRAAGPDASDIVRAAAAARERCAKALAAAGAGISGGEFDAGELALASGMCAGLAPFAAAAWDARRGGGRGGGSRPGTAEGGSSEDDEFGRAGKPPLSDDRQQWLRRLGKRPVSMIEEGPAEAAAAAAGESDEEDSGDELEGSALSIPYPKTPGQRDGTVAYFARAAALALPSETYYAGAGRDGLAKSTYEGTGTPTWKDGSDADPSRWRRTVGVTDSQAKAVAARAREREAVARVRREHGPRQRPRGLVIAPHLYVVSVPSPQDTAVCHPGLHC